MPTFSGPIKVRKADRSVVTAVDASGVPQGAGVSLYAEIALSVAEMKALRATPKTLVAGVAGHVIELLGGVVIYDYAAVFTESVDNLVVRCTDGSGAAASQVIETTGFLDQTSDQIRPILPANDAALVKDASLVLHNNGDGELAGTGSPVRVKLLYRLHAHGL